MADILKKRDISCHDHDSPSKLEGRVKGYERHVEISTTVGDSPRK